RSRGRQLGAGRQVALHVRATTPRPAGTRAVCDHADRQTRDRCRYSFFATSFRARCWIPVQPRKARGLCAYNREETIASVKVPGLAPPMPLLVSPGLTPLPNGAVRFTLHRPEAHTVRLAADFTRWSNSPLPLQPDHHRTWSVETPPLAEGVHFY